MPPASGEIILFLDSDDYLVPLCRRTHCFETGNPTFAKIHYRLEVVDAEGQPLGHIAAPPQGQPLAHGELWQHLTRRRNLHWRFYKRQCLSRQALTQVMPIPNDYRTTADDYLSNLIPFYGEVGAIQEPLAAYRIHTTNQWALTTVNGDRFHRFVHHDLQSRPARPKSWRVRTPSSPRF